MNLDTADCGCSNVKRCDEVFQEKARSDPDLWGRIEAINLDDVRAKLTRDDGEGPGWSGAQFDRYVIGYRRFLFLAVTENLDAVPTKPIDTIWHAHILHTAAYARDCEAAFGRFLHHSPHSRVRSEAERAHYQDNALRTAERYRAVFGEDYAST